MIINFMTLSQKNQIVWEHSSTRVYKKIEFFIFKINIFLVFMNRFDALISKIIFKNYKNILF
jgi:hypothetical protein